MLSILITTRNEHDHIGACIGAFKAYQDRGAVEVIVVDNSSTDGTAEAAAALGARVITAGPERSAQRNVGFRAASGQFVLYIDADMILPPETIGELLALADRADLDGAYIRETRIGKGLWTRARNFERSFYNATCIDCARLIRRALFLETGGFDEALTGPEDWDLDRRLLARGARFVLTRGALLHNETRLTPRKMLSKKAYYAASFSAYKAKWGNDKICRKQFGLLYRYFGVFLEHGKWRKLLRHPILALVMALDRIAVGLVYLLAR